MLNKSFEFKLGVYIVAFYLFVAIFADVIAPYSPDYMKLSIRLQDFSWQHIFGTDELGRDVFSRVIHGTRYGFLVVVSVTLISVPLGFIVGLYAGFLNNTVSAIIMRLIEIFLAFPRLILAMTFAAVLGPGLSNAIFALAFTVWASYARYTISYVKMYKSKEYIQILKCQGASDQRLIFRFIAPLCIEPIIVQISLDMSSFLITVAGLGFLGLGAQPPTPEWGAMISSGKQFGFEHWWLITYPGIAIAIFSLGFNLIGEGYKNSIRKDQQIEVKD